MMKRPGARNSFLYSPLKYWKADGEFLSGWGTSQPRHTNWMGCVIFGRDQQQQQQPAGQTVVRNDELRPARIKPTIRMKIANSTGCGGAHRHSSVAQSSIGQTATKKKMEMEKREDSGYWKELKEAADWDWPEASWRDSF